VMTTQHRKTDVILIGGGIMSATLGTLLKELSPEKYIKVFEKLAQPGADVQYVSIPSNGVWYDHIGSDKERRQAVYKKIHSTVVDNGGKIYDMTDKDDEKYVISDAVHIGWKGWVY
ncbi:D-alanyl-lipoteichoic acid biosynthesis protein DltD, partial [Staphylococcus aureus]|uniref:D-alanyl-lipoteichoic acid biosynthesis protein DltD n=1 Tax=Staphylococcus aureus TaxID=1280 RepID=UPI00351DFA19